ncbi:MAG: TAXI family TRAP transporter solute-binding subunit, partial [Gammaproteobacteria bacterium]|nr:TAXI family TRAP transporter solute-binding subunit [Gammaproteobacteria bacterium]
AAGAAQGGLRIVRRAADEAVMLSTDLDRLSQVFINLIANARKYCDAQAPELRIHVHRVAGRQVVDFIDNGSGIDKADHEVIFEKFSRIENSAGLKATVHPFASATVYLPAVSAGEYAFGISNVEELRVAVIGADQFKGRDYSNLRATTILYPLRTGFFVRKDSPIRSIADLKGKRAVDGFTSQKTIPPLLDALYATAGMTRADVQPVNVPNVVAGADAFMSGKADVFFFALGAAKVEEANASVGGIRALDIANTPENVAKIKKFFPPAYLRAEKPGPRNIGVLDPIHVLTYDGVLVASTKTPDDVVYRMVTAMHANKKANGTGVRRDEPLRSRSHGDEARPDPVSSGSDQVLSGAGRLAAQGLTAPRT